MTIPLGPRIYLASRSPRRRELLSLMGVQFETLLFRNPPRADRAVDESVLADEDPVDYVKRVARAKAEHGLKLVVWRRQAMQPIMAADTTVELNGEILMKASVKLSVSELSGGISLKSGAFLQIDELFPVKMVNAHLQLEG